MFDLRKRLEDASISCNPREHSVDEQNKVGRDAEEAFASTLLRNGHSSKTIFYGLRVPDEYQARKREIDLVLLHETGLYILEIKNWSGKVRLSRDGRSWIQSKYNGSDSVMVTYEIEHENALFSLKRKAKLLRDHLFRCDVRIRDDFLQPRVIFVNEKLHVDKGISEEPQVVTPDKCSQFIESFQRGYVGSIVDSIIPCYFTGRLSNTTLSLASQALSSIGTWDVVHLNGGKKLYGDFKGCPYFSVDRKQTDCLELTHSRSRVMTMTWAILGYSPSAVVSFRQRGSTGWLWNSYRAVIHIPYDTEFVFRICGDDVDSKIIANDVERISLSI
ncbi:uncharacterized protein LOC114529156 [Dendronephthya gigantea]|uniref:uncharacterized protein LOC114529156 n=1 Tax=Dendronephthya gigantea TaxID=151771 RepID=UPI00106B4D32|nr:uncharacterized protein LOC114529156 [Dendronephthya gigantea]